MGAIFATYQKIKARETQSPPIPKPISITLIDSGLEIKIQTYQKRVEDLIKEQNITLNSEDLIFPHPSTEIHQNHRIFIHRPAPQKNNITSYTVQPGDTVSSIAKRFGLTWNTIKWSNNLKDSDRIFPGQTLTILPVNGILHTIKAGENIKDIAAKYKVDENEIIKFNQIQVPEDISPGNNLIVPNSKMPEPLKPKVAFNEKPKTQPKSKTKPKAKPTSEKLIGMASWYDLKSGLGCASLKFPLNTKLKVTNINTGASVEVVVFDRGPYNSRIIDLTKEAFSKIAPLEKGVVKVKVEKIK